MKRLVPLLFSAAALLVSCVGLWPQLAGADVVRGWVQEAITAIGAGVAAGGAAFISPGIKNEAGETVPPALMPAQPGPPSIKNASIDSSHGHTATVSSVMPILVMPEATYRFKPTGG